MTEEQLKEWDNKWLPIIEEYKRLKALPEEYYDYSEEEFRKRWNEGYGGLYDLMRKEQKRLDAVISEMFEEVEQYKYSSKPFEKKLFDTRMKTRDKAIEKWHILNDITEYL